jgi:3-hydroxybutyryl-CoA dehydratase
MSSPYPAYEFSELSIGQRAERTFEVTDATLAAFAEVSGDHNRVHLDQAYAEQTPFRGRIAHGMLTAGYISAVLANQLPGNGTVYLSQDLKFRGPVRPGDKVTVRVTVVDLQAEKKKVVLQTQAFVGEKMVVDGTATVLPPGALK